ncbi:MAG: hypothetical protein M1368_10545, partial [Thaumarchaeota archaeon]|nr:hypothetical protein [Nitrososphaerota archaeon]
MKRKTYALIYVLALLIANVYTFWPAVAYGNEMISCPAIIADLSYRVTGANLAVGPPLYSASQYLLHPGSVAYELEIYNSTSLGNNLTSFFRNTYPYNGSTPNPSWNPAIQYLSLINGFSGLLDSVTSNQTGVSITFQNITFQGIHVAEILYKIEVSKNAPSASYAFWLVCTPGFVLTVGSLPYSGPLPFGRIQGIAVIINNAIALAAA